MNLTINPMFHQWIEHLSTAWPESDLFLGTVGFFEGRGSFDYRQIPQHVSLHVVTAGDGMVEGDGERMAATTGDVFVFWPGRAVHYYEVPQNPWRYTWCYVQGRSAAALLQRLGMASPRLVYPGLGAGFLAAAARWRTELEAGRLHAGSAQAMGWELMGALQAVHQPRATEAPDPATLCKRYIDMYFMNPIGIDGLAAYAGVERTTLFRHFRARYGCSPKQYLQERRFEQARALLAAGVGDGGGGAAGGAGGDVAGAEAATIAAVAAQSGFSTAAHFCRAFREREGCTPSDWRRRRGEGGGGGGGGSL